MVSGMARPYVAAARAIQCRSRTWRCRSAHDAARCAAANGANARTAARLAPRALRRTRTAACTAGRAARATTRAGSRCDADAQVVGSRAWRARGNSSSVRTNSRRDSGVGEQRADGGVVARARRRAPPTSVTAYAVEVGELELRRARRADGRRAATPPASRRCTCVYASPQPPRGERRARRRAHRPRSWSWSCSVIACARPRPRRPDSAPRTPATSPNQRSCRRPAAARARASRAAPPAARRQRVLGRLERDARPRQQLARRPRSARRRAACGRGSARRSRARAAGSAATARAA